ncbi:sn-glycerol-1-phosphate dehydrogenase [uncultured Eubacterium sp.]|uniref:sn-glycerol-1-phosphate dehydrogenase n=1 Tax=uncultured Eubacterium sp. TaxID=165185 RepID=UPI0025992458|nr:sn-glycerol-1-phosphate dehydrogenase [uncultured Eubacterium sp.]
MDVDLGQLREPCACGMEHNIDVEKIVIESGAVSQLEEILEEFQNPVFICDSNTRTAAEPFLEEEFKDYPVIELNPEGLQADNRGVNKVMKQLDYCDRGLSSVSVDVLVAIGSGTIHDLTRYAATEYDIPFVSIPTAASVDGYAANVAALNWDGMKKTVAGVSPRWILADTDIFSAAPSRLTASGVSDFLGKYISILDWKIAHLVTGEYICEEVCDLLEKALRDVSRVLEDIRFGDKDAIEKLMYALLLSGLCMQMVESPRPVSGAEHMVSHLWDLNVLNEKTNALHGEQVGLGLLIVTDYYKKLGYAIRHKNVTVKSETAKGLEMSLLEYTFGKKGLLEGILTENTPNPLEDIDLEELEEQLPEIEDLIDDLPDADDMYAKLHDAGCVHEISSLGIGQKEVELTLQSSPYVRNRLTLLRLSKLLEW